MTDSPRDVLQRFWGYSELRSGQEAAIRSILSGRDTLVLMPTGGGKSLCYQIPAMMMPGVTVVVSPLISLMKDQVDALEEIGLPAAYINSSLAPGEMLARMEEAENGDLKLLYVAPERFETPLFQERASRLRVALLAVDEAHCVSQWGHDFRPSYLRVGSARALLGDPPIMALTATATPEVRRDVERQLELRDPEVLVSGFDRRNLTWHVLRAKNDSEKDRLLVRMLRGREGSSIVYASTRKNVDALTSLLTGVGITAVGYHAGLPDADRQRVQEAFMRGAAPVVVATNAFGMGIDKRDVRLVAHYNLPGTLEAYYQEGGRGGRDGGPADCVMLHAYADRFTHQFFLEATHPPRKLVEDLMRELRRSAAEDGAVRLSAAELARRLSIRNDRQVASALRVLDEHGLVRSLSPTAAGPARVRLIATPQRIARELGGGARDPELKFLRLLWKRAGGEAVYDGIFLEWRELAGLTGARGGAGEMLDRLREEGVLDYERGFTGEGIVVLDRTTRVDRLPVDWRTMEARRRADEQKLRKMEGYAYHEGCRRGYILRYFGDPEAMEQCGACDNCLGGSPFGSGEESDPPRRRRERGGRERGSGPGGRTRAVEAEAPGDPRLYEQLRELRSRLASEQSVPAYCVFSDRTLRALAARRPGSDEELLEVPGVGPAKLERFGEAFLGLLRGFGGEA